MFLMVFERKLIFVSEVSSDVLMGWSVTGSGVLLRPFDSSVKCT